MKKFSPKVEMWDIDKILPYPTNNKKHPETQVAKIAASMLEFGTDVPLVVEPNGMLIKGHGRRLAGIKLGLKQLPVIIRDDLTPAQIKAARIADNRVAESEFDLDALLVELEQLEEMDFDLLQTGFDQDELDALFADANKTAEGNTDPDDVPEVPATPVTVLGDVWVMGNHRICCGDSTDADTVAKVLNGVKPHLMVTDPPYGVSYNPDWRSTLDKVKRATGKVQNDETADWTHAFSLFPGDVAYVWHGERQLISMGEQLISAGFETRNLIVWAKPHFALSRGHYHGQHETCWYAVRKGSVAHWVGDRKQSTVWHIANGTFQGGKAKAEDAKTGHGTQKPVEAMRRPIENNSSPGQAVYEPFSGSGTTIIAGEMTGRAVHAAELNPAYVDVAVKRWSEFTGKDAILEADGRTFNEIAEERAAVNTIA